MNTYNKKIEVTFDDLWTLQQLGKKISVEVEKIKRMTRSVHIQEIIIDERISPMLQSINKITSKYHK